MYRATYFEALFFVKCPQMIPAMYKQDSFSSKCGLPSGFYVVVLHTRRKISRFCLPSLPLTSIAASRTVICYQEFHLENNQSQNNLRFFFMINQLLIIVVGLISFIRVRNFLFQCRVRHEVLSIFYCRSSGDFQQCLVNVWCHTTVIYSK